MSVMVEGIDYEVLPSGAVKMLREITVTDFCEMLDLWDVPGTSCIDVLIVKIKYKYDHESEWTIDNEILEPCLGNGDDGWIWLNDWDEGQQKQYVLGWIALSDLDVVDDAADQMDTKRVYDADEVDALFDGFDNPMCPTAEDQHKAYARLMLSTLKK